VIASHAFVALAAQALTQASALSKLLALPWHPPYENGSHFPVCALKYQLGISASQGPVTFGRLQMPPSPGTPPVELPPAVPPVPAPPLLVPPELVPPPPFPPELVPPELVPLSLSVSPHAQAKTAKSNP